MTSLQIKNGWQKVKIGNLCKVKHGYAFKGEFFSDKGDYIVLTPGNFTEADGLVLKSNKEKYYSGEFPEQYLLNQGDLLVVMTDLKQSAPYLGAPGIVKQNNLLHNQRLGLIHGINEALIDKNYLYWVFQSDDYRGQIRGSATGATVKHTAPERIYACEVFIPTSKKIQQKIASILSTFDDLIEINTKRIKALEETTQLIYKEWFVNFRFPGHERVKMVDSGAEFGEIPEGWEVKTIGGLIEVKKGKNITKETVVEGDVPVVAGGLNPAYYHNVSNAYAPVITISASGANAGYINLYHQDIWASDCSYVDKNVTDFVYYFYLFLKDRQKDVTHLQHGSAQPHVYPQDIMRLLILAPPTKVLDDFKKTVSPKFELIGNLLLQNQKLAHIRDLLLPKLVSGEIEITN